MGLKTWFKLLTKPEDVVDDTTTKIEIEDRNKKREEADKDFYPLFCDTIDSHNKDIEQFATKMETSEELIKFSKSHKLKIVKDKFNLNEHVRLETYLYYKRKYMGFKRIVTESGLYKFRDAFVQKHGFYVGYWNLKDINIDSGTAKYILDQLHKIGMEDASPFFYSGDNDTAEFLARDYAEDVKLALDKHDPEFGQIFRVTDHEDLKEIFNRDKDRYWTPTYVSPGTLLTVGIKDFNADPIILARLNERIYLELVNMESVPVSHGNLV